MRFELRSITAEDAATVERLYNSNPEFLHHHLDRDSIDAAFVENEIRSMQAIGFESRLIVFDHQEIGSVEYKMGEQVYLSILLLDKAKQRRGLGQAAYQFLEQEFALLGASSVRIDVAFDYEENSIGFWQRQGFKIIEKIVPNWCGKTFQAYKMEKKIGEQR